MLNSKEACSLSKFSNVNAPIQNIPQIFHIPAKICYNNLKKAVASMEKYIFLPIAAIIIVGPTIAWRIYRVYRHSQDTKEFVSKPFVCPNCGHRFYAKHTKQKIIHGVGENKAFLKCLGCGKRDICGRPYDFDEN